MAVDTPFSRDSEFTRALPAAASACTRFKGVLNLATSATQFYDRLGCMISRVWWRRLKQSATLPGVAWWTLSVAFRYVLGGRDAERDTGLC